jgi:histidine ammonia-lyase
MHESAAAVAEVVRAERVSYGINTGFGAFANRHIPESKVIELQYNLARSHACGVGSPLAPTLVRRIMLLKANSLAAGISGIRPDTVDALLALLNADVLPVIPAKGSVGASGDLSPLAHLTLALIGEGEALRAGKLLEGFEVAAAAGIAPVALRPKEGLALLNGTQASAALAMEGLFRLESLVRTAVVAGAMTVEGLAGSFAPFDERIHAARGMRGQQRIAEALRALLTESAIHASHAGCDRVQDPYAVRCMPQVLGAVWDTLAHTADILQRECNSVSDNPLIFGDEVISGGNFHAEPLGFVSDFMAIAATELGTMAERRIDLLERRVNPSLNMFLTKEPGLESGLMIAHVTAAALASENKTLAHPASIDSIPTSAGQEDHVSMAPWAGLKLLQICDNLECILAIELLAAARAIEALAPLTTTPEVEQARLALRAVVAASEGDTRHDKEIAAVAKALRAGHFDACIPAACAGRLTPYAGVQ